MLLTGAVSGSLVGAWDTVTDKVKKLESAQSQLTSKTARYQAGLAKLKRAQERTGDSTGRIGAKMAELESKIKRVSTASAYAEKRLLRLQKAERNQAKRAELQGRVMGTVGMVASIATPVMTAVDFESSMADVRKVIDFDSDSEFKKMGLDIQLMGERIPLAVSGLTDIVAAAGQAGIAKKELLGFAEDAAKMGVAFDMAGGQAGEALTGLRTLFSVNQAGAVALGDAYNHLSNNMDARASDLLNIANRAGASAKMIGMNGQSLGALGATLLAMKTPTEVAGTAISSFLGKLATPSRGSARFQAALEQMGIEAEELKKRLKADPNGTLVEVLERIGQSEDKMGLLTDLVGEEHNKTIAKLVEGLGTYKKALGLIADETQYAGSMQKEYEARSKTTANNLQLLKNRTVRLGIAVGSVLLPPLNLVVGALGTVASGGASLVESFPILSGIVMTVTGTLIAFKLAALAGGYAMAFLSDAWIFGTDVINFFKPTTIRMNLALVRYKIATAGAAVATKGLALATGLWTGAINLLKVAWATSPFGIVATVLGVVVAAIWRVYTAWDKLVGAWKSSSGVVDALLNVGKTFFGFGDDQADKNEDAKDNETTLPAHSLKPERAEQDTVKPQQVIGSDKTLPAQSFKPEQLGAVKPQQTINNTFNITQQPGENSEDFAHRVAGMINNSDHGALYDGA